jgi:hypothetical protein
LPKSAFKDVKLLLSLDTDQLRRFDEFFATAASIAASTADPAREISKQLGLDAAAVETVLMVCQFLLSVAADGAKPEEMVNDLVTFAAQNAPGDKDFLASIARKRAALVSLLTPKPARRRALKVESLAHGPQPTVDSFRTVCDVRPVFESVEGKESIVGYVPTILLEAKVSDPDGDNSRAIMLHMTSAMLASLKEVVERTEEKLAAIRAKFGKDLLHD